MSKKKTRERQLARYQAKREAERRRRRRQRITAGIVAMTVAAAALIFLAFTLTGGDEPDPGATDSPTPTGSVSPTATGSPTASPTPEPLPVACGAEEPAAAKEEREQYEKMPPLADFDLDAKYFATIQTSCGTIELELFADQAPYTVNSFVFLAKEGFFDGMVFHRLANSIDVIQSGNPACTTLPCATGEPDGPGYTVPDENFNGLKYDEGAIAMANAGPGTTGSQFFIVTGELGAQLNDQAAWTVFGTVVEGLDVAQEIQELPVGGETGEEPQERIYIEKVTIRVEPAA